VEQVEQAGFDDILTWYKMAKTEMPLLQKRINQIDSSGSKH
jgi:hypothetical protein